MRLRRALATVAAALVALVGPGATAASAHGSDESNYLSGITAVVPASDAFTVRVIELGSRLELTVAPGHTVVVQGYEGEPYLRIGADGVFENQRSTAHWLNRDRYGTQGAPVDITAKDPPVWARIGDGPTARWHDHRIHWMSPLLPPMVQPSPGAPHVIFSRWTVPLVVDATATQIVGRLSWVPTPSTLPWLALAAGCGVVLLLAVRLRVLAPWWAAALALGALVAELAASIGRTGHVPVAAVVLAGVGALALGAGRSVPRLVPVAAAATSVGAYLRLGPVHHAFVRFPGGREVACAAAAVALGLAAGALAGTLTFSPSRARQPAGT